VSVFPLQARGLIADIDGVVLVDGEVLPQTRELIRHYGASLAFVSNNSTHTRESLCGVFRAAGVDVEAGQFFLAGTRLIYSAARDFPGGKALMLATESLRELAREMGLSSVSASSWRDVDLVLLCRDTEVSYARLEGAANAVRSGAPLYCANHDLVHPGKSAVYLETGCFLALLGAVHPGLQPRVFGKPDPALAFDALRYLKLKPEECVFIGDNLETDAPCARAAGIPFLHVGGAEGLPLWAFVGSA
jgi:4-nitrophenyl phosphatase